MCLCVCLSFVAVPPVAGDALALAPRRRGNPIPLTARYAVVCLAVALEFDLI